MSVVLRLMSDYDKWEAQQLQRSGLVSSKENPYYDEEAGGILPVQEAEEDVEIEVVDEEPLFLRGQTTRAGRPDSYEIVATGWRGEHAPLYVCPKAVADPRAGHSEGEAV